MPMTNVLSSGSLETPSVVSNGAHSPPFKRCVCAACSGMSQEDKAKLRERLEQERKSPDQASHAWFQFLHLQLTDEDYSVRKASTSVSLIAPGNVRSALQAW